MKKIISLACVVALFGVACESTSDTTIEDNDAIVVPADSDTFNNSTLPADTGMYRMDTMQVPNMDTTGM